MWLPDRLIVRLLAAVMLLTLPAACNMRPLYGSVDGSAGSSVSADLAAIKLTAPEDRVEQVLQNQLGFRLNGGQPVGDRYTLDLRTETKTSSVLVRTIGGKPQARFVNVSTSYQLKQGDTVLDSGTLSRQASFDWSQQRFANDRAQIDAEDRAATALADDLYALLAGHFAAN
ncbi:MAG: hypothetical protein H6883_04875 [Rhodobiaceae bacterium]|nr:hypothetical protein [Rhodobiaceae bacterium]MCC0055452.1 hypothetical protein [Rhodobiaceae bacterium]